MTQDTTVTGATSSTYAYSCVAQCTGNNSCCSTNFCNCPSGGVVHKTVAEVQNSIGDMRSIMYPVMGIVLGIVWLVMAFLGNGLPHSIILIVVALLDAFFGIFLIFLPTTVYLGLYYIALGAFTIAIVRHGMDSKGITIVILGTIVAFLMTGGLTLIIGGDGDYVDDIYNNAGGCEGSMDILNLFNTYYNVNTRCENFALYVVFCVFLLFLLQPITLISAYFAAKDGGGQGGGGGGGGGQGGGQRGQGDQGGGQGGGGGNSGEPPRT